MEEIKYESLEKFYNDTAEIEKFEPTEYVNISGSEEDLSKEDKVNAISLPMEIKKFPWFEKMVGVIFIIGQIDVVEPEDPNDQYAELRFDYRVVHNPNELELAKDDEPESRDTEANALLDGFIGRMVESILTRMASDKDLMKRIEEENNIEEVEK